MSDKKSKVKGGTMASGSGNPDSGVIYIISDQEDGPKHLAKSFKKLGYQVACYPLDRSSILAIADTSPLCVLLVYSGVSVELLRFCRQIAKIGKFTSIPLIILGDPLEKGFYKKALRAGASDVINIHADSDEIKARIEARIALLSYLSPATDHEKPNTEITAWEETDFLLNQSQQFGQIGSYIFDIIANKWTSSPVLDDIFGISRDAERTKKSWEALIHPEEQSGMLNYLVTSVITGKMPFDKEYRIIRACDGALRWVWGKGALTFDATGNPIKLIGTVQDITEKKAAEAKLLESEKKFRNLFYNAPTPQSMTAIDGSMFVNQAFCEMVGYSEESLRKMNFSQITHPDDLADSDTVMKKLVSGDANQARIIKRFFHKNGNVIWADLSTYMQRDEQGQPLYFITTISDITVQKQAEEKLLKLNRLYAFISQTNQMFVRTKDRLTIFYELARISVEHGKFLMSWIGLVNEKTELVDPIVWYGNEEGYLAKIPQITVADTPEGRGPTGTAIREGHYIYSNDILNDPRMGPWKHEALSRGFRSSITIPFKMYGKVIGAFTLYAGEPFFFVAEETQLLEKITENLSFVLELIETREDKSKIEDELLESELKFKNLVDLVPVGIFRADVQGRTQYVNASWCVIAGMNQEQAMDEGWLNAVHHDDVELIEEIWRNKIASGSSMSLSFRFIHQDGSIIWVSGKVEPFHNRNGQLEGFVGYLIDITSLKRAEEELQESEEKFRTLAERSSQAIVLLQNEKLVYTNSAFTDITGFTFESFANFSSDHRIELFHPDDQQEVRQWRTDLSLKKPLNAQNELRIFTANGETKWILASIKSFMLQHQIAALVIFVDITARKLVDIELEKTNRLLTNMMNNSNSLIYMLDLEGRFISVNRYVEFLLGKPASEIIGKFREALLPAEIAAKHRENDLIVINSRQPMSFEEENFVRGKKHCYFTTKFPLIDPQEKLYGIAGISTDITARIEYEDALRKSDDFNRVLLKTIPFEMDIVGLDGTILFMNENLKSRFTEDMTGQKCWSIYCDDSIQCVSCPLKQEIEIGETAYTEADRMMNGRFYLITQTAMMYNGEKAILEIFQDTTDRKEAEKNIRLLAYALENISESVSIFDKDWNFQYINHSFTKAYGYQADEVAGKSIDILFSPNDIEKFRTEVSSDAIKGEYQGETTHLKKDTSPFPVLLSTSALYDDSGSPYTYIMVSIDITEIKKNTQELIAAKDKAEEINRLKSNFLANMSHELRTPMIGILGYSEILMDATEDEDTNRSATIINKSGHRLLDTLNLILNLSRIEAGQLSLELKPVDIVQVIAETCKLFSGAAFGKSLDFEFNSEFPELLLDLDEKLFREIVNNLINNAIKFTAKGSVRVSISREKCEEGYRAVIKIIDTGIGIAKSDQAFIWDEFRQASEGKNRAFEGTGLGLSITKRFVEKLNGDITVESDLGKGSTFIVSFPFTSQPQTQKPALSDTVVQPSRISKLIENSSLPDVLYVENDPVSVMLLQKFLTDVCVIDHAKNKKETMSKINKKKYAAVLMDINLGKNTPDGIAVTKEIRQLPQYQQTPIVAVTAFAMHGDKETFLAEGCSHYLAKPFSRSQIVNLMQSILR